MVNLTQVVCPALKLQEEHKVAPSIAPAITRVQFIMVAIAAADGAVAGEGVIMAVVDRLTRAGEVGRRSRFTRIFYLKTTRIVETVTL